MFENVLFVAGQIFGIIPIALGFISFQAKTSRGIIFWQLSTTVAFSIHYLMIGAWTGVAINLLAAVMSVCYYFRDKAGSKSPVFPIVFSILGVVATIFTWQAWFALFLLAGLLMNTLSFALLPPDKVRYVMLVKGPVTAMYNVFALSIPGIIYETVIFISSIIGLIRYSGKTKEGN